MLEEVPIPPLAVIRQRFDATELPNPAGAVHAQFQAPWVRAALAGKRRVGITVGSRGICNLPDIVRALCDGLKAEGIEPFLVPSMGSHGGATAEGQAHVIRELGFAEERMGAKILAGMEVTLLGTTELGLPAYYDTLALGLDGVIVLGRVKAHTDLSGDVESGLQKMIAVGLGDHRGAQVIHAKGLDKAVPRLKSVAGYALDHANILFGIALLENAYDRTCEMQWIPREDIRRREPELLARSKTYLPRFLFPEIDVLIVDYIGKNISGDGMDPNIIGRSMTGYKNRDIQIDNIVTLALTPETMTSALGVGLSDVTTRRIYEKLDLDVMYVNAITALALKGAHLPIVMDTDRLAIQLAVKAAQARREDGAALRVARIRDTLHLDQIQVSPAILEDVRRHPAVTVLQEPQPLAFDGAGNLPL